MNDESEKSFRIRELQESLESQSEDPALHFNLGILLWEKGEDCNKEKAAEHFVRSAKLNPQNGPAFRYLGHYYHQFLADSERALKCYQRAITLDPQDSFAGETLCDLLDQSGKETLQFAICNEAISKSPRSFWAYRRLGFLQVHQSKWSESIQSLQHAIRGYPTSADLWEALGLAYQQMGMFTAAIKSYGRAVELEDYRVFALVESGNVFLMLGAFRKGVEVFHEALKISPQNVSALYGLASVLLSLAKECVDTGAFKWGASLLEEASEVALACSSLESNLSSIWKLHGDIQLLYAKCFPWMDEDRALNVDEKKFISSILSWTRSCYQASVAANNSYQRALHLAPWQANLYVDIAVAEDLRSFLKENWEKLTDSWSLPEKMCLGGLLFEGHNNEFWVALGCVSSSATLKQHAFIRGLHLDVSQAVAWAYLGKLYWQEGQRELAQHAFDRARSIDPSLALPWAGMAADAYARKLRPDDAFECCLRAVQILPLSGFQMGLAKLAHWSGNLSSFEVFGGIRQAVLRAPHCPESHNLNGLVSEARCDYHSAVISYRMARYSLSSFSHPTLKLHLQDVSINLARSLCQLGYASDAVKECENLKKEGLLNANGLQIYALSLWQLGERDLSLSVARMLAASIPSMEKALVSSAVSFICRLTYYVSGMDSAVKSILKMPKHLFQSSKLSFVVSAIHTLDDSNQLEPVVSSSRSMLASSGDRTAMHILESLGKLVKYRSGDTLGIQEGISHLKKALHMFPEDASIRSFLGNLLVSSKEWEDLHVATRCLTIDHFQHQKVEALKSPWEIMGAGAVACCTTKFDNERFLFPTCQDQWHSGPKAIQKLQQCLHHEPWNHNVRYLLVLCYFQKAREERFPRYLCGIIERLTDVALSDQFNKDNNRCELYKKFQLLLCAAEVALQSGNARNCIDHAQTASQLLLPKDHLFFAHLLLCRAYSFEGNLVSLAKEYKRCMELKTNWHIGWIGLKFIISRHKLENQPTELSMLFEECSKDIRSSWNMWMATFSLVEGLIAIWTNDFLVAEEHLLQACSLGTRDSCLYVCHGAICMELAKQHCDSLFLNRAIQSLKKAKQTSVQRRQPLPIVSLLLAQAEASLGSKAKWERNLQDEFFAWPPGLRPAELFLQMSLLPTQSSKESNAYPAMVHGQSRLRWVLQAIHMNPSCMRYWKVLTGGILQSCSCIFVCTADIGIGLVTMTVMI
ncbi:hypothetical protein Leryth_000310 [Lithospermum erythrorhizon]|nr:hypothetical protein Leryth_000310 [Lithospermum erythrorhizon]